MGRRMGSESLQLLEAEDVVVSALGDFVALCSTAVSEARRHLHIRFDASKMIFRYQLTTSKRRGGLSGNYSR